jgi:hypothetical protein
MSLHDQPWTGKHDPNKRVEIANFLATAEAAGLSGREVARRFGVGHQLVGQIRAELGAAGRLGVDDSARGTPDIPNLNHPPQSPAGGPKPTSVPVGFDTLDPKSVAVRLNSLSWLEASPQLRLRFIDAVGPINLFDAMTKHQQAVLVEHITRMLESVGAE